MTNGAPPADRPDWTALVIPLVVGGFFIAFYVSLLNAPPLDRVFITPLMFVGSLVLAAVLWEEVQLLRGRASPRPDAERPEPVSEPWRVLGFIGLMVVYFLGLEYIGFFVSSFAMLIVGMLWLGEREPLRLITVPVVLVGVEWLLFAEVLEIPFPPSAVGLF